MGGPRLAEMLLGGAAGDRDDRLAVREPLREWTYGQLRSEASRVAGTLSSLGTRAGDRVLILMPDGLEAVASVLGAWWCGAVAVPLSELMRPNDLRAAARDSAPRVAVVHASLEPTLDEIRKEVPSMTHVVVLGGSGPGELSYEELVRNAAPGALSPRAGNDAALIFYSSGTGRAPKGVLHTHASIIGAARTVALGALAMTASDRVLATNKLSTASGMSTGLVFPLLAGGQSILVPVQPRARVVLDTVRAFQPTIMFATPSLYSHLCDDADEINVKPGAFASLRLAVAGGEGFPAELQARVRSRLELDVVAGYGVTEAFSFVIMNPAGASRAGSLGKAIPGYDARVVDEAREGVADSEIGVLEVRGPSLATGYFQNDEATRTAFVGGWLHTGDRVFRDADGYLFFASRDDDLFKVSGKWVSPLEVEAALLRHEAVWECAVVGADDDSGLTKPFAFVVANVGHAPGPELADQLKEFVKNELAPFKYPRWIEFVDELPKGPGGGILRYKLTARPPRHG